MLVPGGGINPQDRGSVQLFYSSLHQRTASVEFIFGTFQIIVLVALNDFESVLFKQKVSKS